MRSIDKVLTVGKTTTDDLRVISGKRCNGTAFATIWKEVNHAKQNGKVLYNKSLNIKFTLRVRI